MPSIVVSTDGCGFAPAKAAVKAAASSAATAASAQALDAAYDAKFDFLFQQLGVVDTAPLVAKYVKPAPQHRGVPGGTPGVVAAPDDPDAGE